MWRGGQNKSQLRSRLILEAIFQTELDQPRCNGSGLDFSEASVYNWLIRDWVDGVAGEGRAWIGKLRMVEGIVEVGAKFQSSRFTQASDLGRFNQSHIKVGLMWSAEGGASCVAITRAVSNLRKWTGVLIGYCSERGARERKRIKVLIQASLNTAAGCHLSLRKSGAQLGARSAPASEDTSAGRVSDRHG